MNSMIGKMLALSIALVFSPFLVADEQRLVLTGSSTIAPLALEVARRYEQEHPGAKIDVQTGGSSRGINDVRKGLADIGMVSRALKESEHDMNAHLIAVDGIGIIVHRSNPVAGLTEREIIAIYTGEVRNWRAVGGPNRQITTVNKAGGRSTLELFLQYFKLRNSQIKAHIIIGDNQQGIKTVSGNPGAIAYVSIGTAVYEETRGTPVKLVKLAGEAATVAAVANGSYPLSRQLNLVTTPQLSPLARDFIDFAQSPAVRELIEGQFFVVP